MCDFNNLDDAAKEAYHKQLSECAAAFGGTNFFLQLIEAVRKSKPHPLIAKNCTFHCSRGSITWNKVIFNDKLALLMKVRVGESERGNLLPDKNDKGYKKVLNLVRTLRPLTFEIQPKSRKDGEGFSIQPFDVSDEHTTRLNPIFDAIFFCAVETVKKVLAYTPKTS